MAYDFLSTPIEYLKGVGPQRAKLLQSELDVYTFEDLLGMYPFRYVDRSKYYSINQIKPDAAWVQIKGKVMRMETVGKGRGMRLVVQFSDGSGTIELVWFKGIKWIKEKVLPAKEYVVFGKPTLFKRKFNIAHPEIEEVRKFEEEKLGGLQPVYNTSEKMKAKSVDSRTMARLTKTLIQRMEKSVPEFFPKYLLDKHNLCSREYALRNIHFPSSQEAIKKASYRLKFEELFFNQLILARTKWKRQEKVNGFVFGKVGDNFNRFYKEKLPFELTGAQKKVIREIRHDLGSGKQMNRLLQGDVGSGKTMVALMCMLLAVDNGFQACLMAPTEILANQHYNNISKFLEDMGIQVALLTGSIKTSERKPMLEGLKDGSLSLLIGTHALIEETVVFKNIGLAVIDEQHRFGVEQRAKMWAKNQIPPHILVMTATPIPRTLAMTSFGDLDNSVIDELPPGRKPIKTFWLTDENRLQIFGFMKERLKEGRQVYVVYPLINESETLDLKDIQDGYESLARAFPNTNITVVHGKMKADDKDYGMNEFKNGIAKILVATTVIEVGVDIPNATTMVIENAERFGLSQLHQLRGRVGRGAEQSYCLLVSKTELSQDARTRLDTMRRTNDGFQIAEADLQLRGPGELGGTRQSGLTGLKISDIIKDEAILKTARKTAWELVDKDPQLQQPPHTGIRFMLQRLNRQMRDFSEIS